MRNATRILTAAMGTLMGLGGLEHGIGEILQGNIAPSGIMFPSWPESAFFRIVGGEPAMTIIPNLLITGILTILVSLIFIGWATLFVQKKNGGLVLILISIILLLVGGGMAPPVLGIIIGAAATRIHAPQPVWTRHLAEGFKHFLVKIWPGSFITCLIAWLMMFPGLSILSYATGMNDPAMIPALFFLALGLLLLTIFTGFAHDSFSVDRAAVSSQGHSRRLTR
jgi:hypothetical protein